MDKLASKETANLPVTVIDRLWRFWCPELQPALVKLQATTQVAQLIFRSVRRGVWFAVLSIFTTLLIGKAANDLGLTGTTIYNYLFSKMSLHPTHCINL